MPIQFFGKTDIGSVRDTNQDNFFADYLDCGIDEQVFLAVVCDGMGGASGGSFASSLAIKTFVSELCAGLKNVSEEKLSIDSCELLLSYAAKCANSAVYNAAQSNSELHGMGTTLVGMMVFRNTVYALNIGDSRLYVLAEDGMCKLTRDHSYVQALVDQGKISEAEAKVHPNKNVIMRAVGTDAEVAADFFKILPDRKSFLLCSDGLSNFVDDISMEKIIVESDSVREAVNTLIEKANTAGGGDNITAILVRF
ncbi:MAG: Stp1/IreP family PP2C-type Ser/Thr phosphatase [Ruminococcaceae bacterium]|nr:Stp1/IreP family PP2C-type Ser/Thr phosphatase [Oscillospiraceae bacterium]